MRFWTHLLTLCCLLTVAPAWADTAEQTFEQDLKALTAHAHRLAGTPEGQAAADYIQQRLRKIGVENVLRMDLPVWQTRVIRCELTIDGKTVPLWPMRPNMFVPPVTPPEGFTGPLLYAGRGRPEDYGSRSPQDAIVVLDYDSPYGWETALSMGAKAVIFLSQNEVEIGGGKYAPVPANYVRLFAPPDTLKQLDLKKDYPAAKVVSHIRWELGKGANVLAFLPGTDAGFVESRVEPEMLVLAVDYDTFGQVPDQNPGARQAANVAALLETVAFFQEHRPKRDLLVMFLDNHARYHQGARWIYDAIGMREDDAQILRDNHRQEQTFTRQLRQIMTSPPGQSLFASRQQIDSLIRLLDRQAQQSRSQVNDQLVAIRLQKKNAAPELIPELHAKEIPFSEATIRWDEIRRVLNAARRSPSTFDPHHIASLALAGLVKSNPDWTDAQKTSAQSHLQEEVASLLDATLGQIDYRLAEIDRLLVADQQRDALRRLVAGRWIIMHAAYDYSDAGPVWSFVAGHAIGRIYSWTRQGADVDTPGYHKRLLQALGRVAREAGVAGLDTRPLEDPDFGVVFTAGDTVPSGMIAGIYGIYNVALTSGYDNRPREGNPVDTLANLNWHALRAQAVEGTKALAAAADSRDVSLPRIFRDLSQSYRPLWSATQEQGNLAVLKATGSLTEDWPATEAVIAVFPSAFWFSSRIWDPLDSTQRIGDFEPFIFETADARGRFPLIGVNKNDYSNAEYIGAMFDVFGQVRAITNQATAWSDKLGSIKIELFPGQGYSFVNTFTGRELTNNVFRALRAVSNADLRPNRSLVGFRPNFSFFYAHNFDIEAEGAGGQADFKLIQKDGPLVLRATPQNPVGDGLSTAKMAWPAPIDAYSAQDILTLNESRLATLRSGGVRLPDLERLHRRGHRLLESSSAALLRDDQATPIDPQRKDLLSQATLESRQAALGQALALGRQVYEPLRAAMDDLVNGIVILLLLAIPFAFSLERLLICASSVYTRVGGFALCFIITFILLYLVHPGFGIASTPMMILLAFTIILLSSLVCFIIMRKFRDELMTIQGQGGGRHAVEISRMGTLLAAVGMGMSTMRRRPLRTTLTAVTVVMLTFTILCFASVSSQMGVREVYEGPPAEGQTAALMVRQLDYSNMNPYQTTLLLGGSNSGRAFLAEQWWKVKMRRTDAASSVARADTGRALTVDAIMGIDPQELDYWPALGDGLYGQILKDKQQALADNGVFLPRVLADQLGLKIGDPVLLEGQRLRYAGTVDVNAMQKLRQLDGRSVLPVDFVAFELERQQQQGQVQTLNDDRVQRDFQRLSPNQVAITSTACLRKLGGNLHILNVYPQVPADAIERGRQTAELVSMPVWARGEEGIYRMFFTTLTEVSGGLALIVPVLLGGLIIFGTMLGSITDREKEIYTFSALGLGPAHVGFLFFAEAAVYAVIGGMGGQLLAQGVAHTASKLAQWGLIQAPAINFSSTNSLFAIGVVMATVLVSAIYPAYRASKSANPGLARAWKMPPPQGDLIQMKFPFTVSAYDITGVLSFLAEHFRQHDDAGLGIFATRAVKVTRHGAEGHLALQADLALAPFDLGVTQFFTLRATPSEIPGVDEVQIDAHRQSGATPDWYRANRVFVQDLRKQFLLWRTLSSEAIEAYRQQTLQTLAAPDGSTTAATQL
ncbi:MAG: hypothetical protein IT443_11675 [Phycisphaeraceae bacterium]|nr:hypothetical protein [Phycisphaeraceae bacterium]